MSRVPLDTSLRHHHVQSRSPNHGPHLDPRDRGRISVRRKTDAVLRLLRCEDLELRSRELGITAATLSGWRDDFHLYLVNRDGSGLTRLTEGDWTDSMADWSPDGSWIVFASDRDGEFELWMFRPDGSGLRDLLGGGARDNHPHFSPDGAWVFFASQRAGHSVEKIAMPDQLQPYGDLFAIRTDGTGLVRLIHNGFEEGTPAWGSNAVRRETP